MLKKHNWSLNERARAMPTHVVWQAFSILKLNLSDDERLRIFHILSSLLVPSFHELNTSQSMEICDGSL